MLCHASDFGSDTANIHKISRIRKFLDDFFYQKRFLKSLDHAIRGLFASINAVIRSKSSYLRVLLRTMRFFSEPSSLHMEIMSSFTTLKRVLGRVVVIYPSFGSSPLRSLLRTDTWSLVSRIACSPCLTTISRAFLSMSISTGPVFVVVVVTVFLSALFSIVVCLFFKLHDIYLSNGFS